jgi:hypothetical protein
MDLTIDQLPLPEDLKNLLIRRHRAVLLKGQVPIARGQDLGSRFDSAADIHFSLIPREDRTHNVLIMFEPTEGEHHNTKRGRKHSSKPRKK